MEQTNFEKVCAIEKRIDKVLCDLQTLNEELFNASSCELQNLPIGYLSTDKAIEKASSLLNLTEQALKIQAYLADKALLEGEINEAKDSLLEAAFNGI